MTRTYTINGQSITLKFKDSIHTPQLALNLISVGRLCNVGFKDRTKALVFDGNGNGFTCMHGTDGLYRFDEDKLKESKRQNTKAFALNTKPANLETWHRQFAHTNMILEMSARGLVDGLAIMDRTLNGKCKDCLRGKATANPHTRPITDINDITERLACTNLWGPSPVRSTGGALYFMPIVDVEHHVREIYFLSNKEAPTMLQVYKY